MARSRHEIHHEPVHSALSPLIRGRLTTLASSRDEDAVLLECAAALCALDDHHEELRDLYQYTTVSLPVELGGRQWLFLPPARHPFQELIKDAHRELLREGYRYETDLMELLHLWWCLVPVEGPVRPRVREMDSLATDILERRMPDLRLALAAPFASLGYTFTSRPDHPREGWGTPYRFEGLSTGSRGPARDETAAILARCRKDRVDILIFPELTLDPEALTHLAKLLRTENRAQHPALVVAGSFHVPAETPGRWANRCIVLDGTGEVLWSHDKLVRFSIPEAEAAHLPGGFLSMIGIDRCGGLEDIQIGEVLEVRDGPLGRMVALICLDYCGEPVRELVANLRVGVFLVPAMSTSMVDFENRAREWGSRLGASTFVANSAWVLQNTGKKDIPVALACLPARNVSFHPLPDGDPVKMFTIRELLTASSTRHG